MARVTCLPTVQIRIVTPALCRILQAVCDDMLFEHVITSIADGVHLHDSAHYRGEAVDIRTRDLALSDAAAFGDRMERALGPAFLVLLEKPGDTPYTSAQHLHVQLKSGQTWPPPPAA